MTRATPPRPVDILAAFPELERFARAAVRLHPRPGAPTSRDSSIGGPLLWPVDEPWPTCAGDHEEQAPLALADVGRQRQLLKAAWRRPRQPGQNLLTPEETATLEAARTGHPPSADPNAMLAVAQLHARDVPGLPCPEGTDLLQMLWCPVDHDDFLPAAHLVWRSAAAVGAVLADPPVPADVDHFGVYVPEPCVLHPEAVTEFPDPLVLHDLDEALAERIRAWNDREYPPAPQGTENAGRRAVSYQFDLSLAPGWKVGGWAPWSFSDPWPMACELCAAPMEPLITVASSEWDGGSHSWIPLEDRDQPTGEAPYPGPSEPTMVSIGRGYNLQLYTCSASLDHPPQHHMQ